MRTLVLIKRLAMVVGVAGALCLGLPAAAQAGGHDRSSIRVFVAGDSTAATYATSEAPRAGWGQALPVFLAHRVTVVNEALSGASSKSFVDLGRLDRILAAIQPGDYLLISFGHNDEKADAERHTDPYTTFQDYLRLYVDGARAHHANPVLVTPVERRRFDATGHATASHGQYPDAMRQFGATTGVPVIDLTALSMRLWDEQGVAGTQDFFLWLAPGDSLNYPDGVQDNTHFKAHGAIEVARLVATALHDGRIMPRGTIVQLCRQDIPDSALVWPAERPA
jgi:lysophospholipase L1-like esterase